MKTAQALIRQRRYDEARQILRELNTPLSRSWLLSLEGLGGGENAKVNHRRRLVIGVVLVLVLIGVFVAVLILEGQYAERKLLTDAERTMGVVDQQNDLQAECDRRGYTPDECNDWILRQALRVTIEAPVPLPNGNNQNLPSLPKLQ